MILNINKYKMTIKQQKGGSHQFILYGDYTTLYYYLCDKFKIKTQNVISTATK